MKMMIMKYENNEEKKMKEGRRKRMWKKVSIVIMIMW